MTFLSSLWWLAGLALIPPAIVIMYLLKLKRQRVVMPSTLLWRRSVQDLIANAPFQKLRNNLLLWLQLLIACLLIFAFLRPVMKLENSRGMTLIIAVDNSASMQTREQEGKTRLELAKTAALNALDTLSTRDEAIVLSFSNRTNIIQTLTTDKSLLRTAIESVEPQDVPTSMKEAGLILQELTTTFDPQDNRRDPLENTRTIVLSDGRIDDITALVDIPNVEYVRIGSTSDNLGITNVDVRESFSDVFEYQIFASVTNADVQKRTAYLELSVGGEIIDLKSAEIEPGDTESFIYSSGEEIDGIATLRLDGRDHFPLDDVAYVQFAPPDKIGVLLVSDGNEYLERVFQIDPRVELSKIRPADYSPGADYDLVVFDNCRVSEIPAGNFLFINTLPPVGGFEAASEPVTAPRIIDWNRVHPLTRFANFEDVYIVKAMDVTIPRPALPIIEAIETPLVSLYETDNQKIIFIAFDVVESLWRTDVSFPIFMANVLEYISRTGQGSVRPTYATGSTIPISPERDANRASVRLPDEEDTIDYSFEGISTAYLTNTQKAGVYHVDFDTGTRLYLPVNLLSETESMIEPVEELQVGGRAISGSNEVVKINQEIWHWFVLLGLGVLLMEWMIYCRRTFM